MWAHRFGINANGIQQRPRYFKFLLIGGNAAGLSGTAGTTEYVIDSAKLTSNLRLLYSEREGGDANNTENAVFSGYRGGGFSYLSTANSIPLPITFANFATTVLAASAGGGGGGAGESGQQGGDGGGSSGEAGGSGAAKDGQGGTQSSGGTAGTQNGAAGTDGSFFTGGTSIYGSQNRNGGGGGAGWYGGGGSGRGSGESAGGAGGGGSCHANTNFYAYHTSLLTRAGKTNYDDLALTSGAQIFFAVVSAEDLAANNITYTDIGSDGTAKFITLRPDGSYSLS